MASERRPRAEHLQPAFRRAGRAKLALATVGIAVFAGTVGLARRTYASHPKGGARPLAAPASFERTVRRDLLRGGALAPPQEAPPDAQTSAS